ELASFRIHVLGQETERGPVREHVTEELARFVPAAYGRERIDVPERADVECGLGEPEVVGVDVAEHVRAGLQLRFARGERRKEARIVRPDELQIRKRQQARIERVAAERGDEALALLVPRGVETL